MKKICFISQFPPPIHGLSKAVETLYASEGESNYSFEKIDITNNRRFLSTLVSIYRSNADLFYFTNSQTIGGNIRDLIILGMIRKKRAKCLMHLHGGYFRTLIEEKMPKWQRKANCNAISKLDGVIVLGNSLKPIFEGMIESDKIYVVPNCVDDIYLTKNSVYAECNDNNVSKVLYLSNMIESKGYREVLTLAKLEKMRFEESGIRKFEFHFAGAFFDENDKKFFNNYIDNYELSEYVHYHGVVLGKEKLDLLQKCDFFVLLTRYPKEGQPISILEAMGNYTIIVSTNYAGIPDIVSGDAGNILIDVNRFNENDDLSDAVKQIYDRMLIMSDDKENMRLIKEMNRRLIETNYREKMYVENMHRVFDALLMDA